MYRELGGYLGYQKTPLSELMEIRLSMIAEANVQKAREDEAKEQQEKLERERERLQAKYR